MLRTGSARIRLHDHTINIVHTKIDRSRAKSGQGATLEALEQVHSLTALMETIHPEGLEELAGAMETALDTGLSFLDSSYIQATRKNGLDLVTEDTHLLRYAEELGLNCIRAKECSPQS